MHHNAGISQSFLYLQPSERNPLCPALRLFLDAFGTAGFPHKIETSASAVLSKCLYCASVACFIPLCYKRVLSVFDGTSFSLSYLHPGTETHQSLSRHWSYSHEYDRGAKFPGRGQGWDHVILGKLDWGCHIP